MGICPLLLYIPIPSLQSCSTCPDSQSHYRGGARAPQVQVRAAPLFPSQPVKPSGWLTQFWGKLEVRGLLLRMALEGTGVPSWTPDRRSGSVESKGALVNISPPLLLQVSSILEHICGSQNGTSPWAYQNFLQGFFTLCIGYY